MSAGKRRRELKRLREERGRIEQRLSAGTGSLIGAHLLAKLNVIDREIYELERRS